MRKTVVIIALILAAGVLFVAGCKKQEAGENRHRHRRHLAAHGDGRRQQEHRRL